MNEYIVYDKYINKETKSVYDIGAHIGQMSILFAQKDAKHIYSFEPSLFNFIELKSNTINFPNILCFDVALHEKEYKCMTKFKDCAENRLRTEQDREQPIKYVILENFIKENNIIYPDFIKMDIEGMETIVLKTCEFLFKKSRPIIYVELHNLRILGKDNNFQRYENNPHWFYPSEGGFDFNILKKYNYRIINNESFIPINIEEEYNPTNNNSIVLIPKEKI